MQNITKHNCFQEKNKEECTYEYIDDLFTMHNTCIHTLSAFKSMSSSEQLTLGVKVCAILIVELLLIAFSLIT